MASFTQSPSGQQSLSLTVAPVSIEFAGEVTSLRITVVNDGIVYYDYSISGNGTTLNLDLSYGGGGSGGGGSVQLPTTGQIWPSGFYYNG